MEQVTPSGFKPNFKFEKCKRCRNQKDYLNEFRICNLCCKQMEQATPSGFKPNFEFKACKKCRNQRIDYLSEFNECNSCHKQVIQITVSGNKIIDNFISHTQM